MNVAIVHDYLIQYGGAERTLEAFHELFPEAPIYTSIYALRLLPRSFEQMDVRTSFLQKFPLAKRGAQKEFLLFYPLAFRESKRKKSEEMGRRGREEVRRRFNTDAYVERMLSIYKRILDKTNSESAR